MTPALNRSLRSKHLASSDQLPHPANSIAVSQSMRGTVARHTLICSVRFAPEWPRSGVVLALEPPARTAEPDTAFILTLAPRSSDFARPEWQRFYL